MSSTSQLSRLFFMACELHPDLPPANLVGLLGKSWAPLIKAGAEYGLAGSAAALPTVSYDQLTNFFMAGAEPGAEPSLDEFRSALAGAIYERICGVDSISNIDQIKMAGQLGVWLEGRASANGEEEMDWDADVQTPPFTKTGFWPLDDLHGAAGMPQETCTVLARPGVGKTTIALATAFEWRRQGIGSVVMLQTEIAPSALMGKIRAMEAPGEKLFRPGVDRLVFGRRNCAVAMRRMVDNPDPDRLVLFDSATGYCGQGDDAASRTRYAELYEELCQIKNVSRMAIAFTHVKRGTDMADIESAAGSSAIERFSGGLVYLSGDGVARPDGMVELKAEILKNRYGGLVRPIKFVFNYKTGKAYEGDVEAFADGEELS